MRPQRHWWPSTVEELHGVQGGQSGGTLSYRPGHPMCLVNIHPVLGAGCWDYSRKVSNKFALKLKPYSQGPVLDGMRQGG